MIIRTYPDPFWVYSNSTGPSFKKTLVDNNIEIEIEIPGVDKSEIELNYSSEKLSINLSVESKNISKDIYLANQVDPEAIEAKLERGVLTLICPIKSNNRKINIE